MSSGGYYSLARTVVIDDGVLYSIIYEDGKLLTTKCPEKTYWLKLELAHLVRSIYIFGAPFLFLA